MGVAVGCVCVFRSGLAFGGVRVRCLCVRCVLCLVCLPLRVRPRVCPVPVLRFCLSKRGRPPRSSGRLRLESILTEKIKRAERALACAAQRVHARARTLVTRAAHARFPRQWNGFCMI